MQNYRSQWLNGSTLHCNVLETTIEPKETRPKRDFNFNPLLLYKRKRFSLFHADEFRGAVTVRAVQRVAAAK